MHTCWAPGAKAAAELRMAARIGSFIILVYWVDVQWECGGGRQIRGVYAIKYRYGVQIAKTRTESISCFFAISIGCH